MFLLLLYLNICRLSACVSVSHHALPVYLSLIVRLSGRQENKHPKHSGYKNSVDWSKARASQWKFTETGRQSSLQLCDTVGCNRVQRNYHVYRHAKERGRHSQSNCQWHREGPCSTSLAIPMPSMMGCRSRLIQRLTRVCFTRLRWLSGLKISRLLVCSTKRSQHLKYVRSRHRKEADSLSSRALIRSSSARGE